MFPASKRVAVHVAEVGAFPEDLDAHSLQTGWILIDFEQRMYGKTNKLHVITHDHWPTKGALTQPGMKTITTWQVWDEKGLKN